LIATSVDSLRGAVGDTLSASAGDSMAASAGDSLAGAGADSTAEALPPAALDRPQDFERRVADQAVQERRFETLDDLLREIPDLSLRVDGDRGMRPYLSTNPLDPGWVEIDVDGIPSQDPSSDEPALWDLPAVGLAEVLTPASESLYEWGPSRLRLRTEGGLEGATHMRTRFSSAADETYYRAVSVRTPESDRALRLDFGEWKTDQGTLFTVSPNSLGRVDLGRSKMRRFALGTDLDTGVGRLSIRYGRGTRFFRGTVASPQTIERWHGRLSATLRHESSERRNLLQGYHLDWHVDDAVHGEFRDASRRGLRWESLPRSGMGWFQTAEFELRSARFQALGDSVRVVRGSRLARWSAGVRTELLPALRATVMADLLHSENARRDLDVGGGAELQWEPRASTPISLGVRRRLRAPSLLETDGWSKWDTVQPTDPGYDPTVSSWFRRGVGDLPAEIQELAYLRTETRWKEWGLRLGIEHWRLRDGIGWVREGVDQARFVGGLELDRTQLVGGLRWRHGVGSGEWHLTAWGHRVLGRLQRDESRGGGWPLYASFARLGISHPFFSSHNRIGIDVVSRVTGPRFDDRHVILGATSPAVRELDLEASLVIRDAEIRVGYDNLLDATLDEVLGTFRRGRQLRLSLRWDFFN
jgi:hypothetical protein